MNSHEVGILEQVWYFISGSQAMQVFLTEKITLCRMVEEKCMQSRDPSILLDMRSMP